MTVFKKWWFWMIVAALALAISIAFYYKKRQTAFVSKIQSGQLFTPANAQDALAVVANIYGADIARKIEQLYRFETANFTSTQYQLCGSPGMQAASSIGPYYGWGPNTFWLSNPQYTPVGTSSMFEGTGLSAQGGNAQSSNPVEYVVLPSVEAGMMFLAYYAQKYANEGGLSHWYSSDPSKQQLYAMKLNQESTVFTDNLS